jgi:hypothetical protein
MDAIKTKKAPMNLAARMGTLFSFISLYDDILSHPDRNVKIRKIGLKSD